MKHYKLFISWEGKKNMKFECEGLSYVGLVIYAKQLMRDKYIGHLINGYVVK